MEIKKGELFMKRRCGCAALWAVCLLLSGVCSAWADSAGISKISLPAETFSDVKAEDWYYQAVKDMSRKGVIEGYPDGSFRPSKTVTCGEFIKMAAAAAGVTENELAGEEDRPKHWALPWYEKGLDLNWYTKDDMGAGKMDRKINRGQMALIAEGVLETVSGKGAEENDKWLDSYSQWMAEISDVDARTPYEYEIICAYGNGILTGYPDGSFRPGGFLSRAEAAVVISRLVDAAAKAGAASLNAETQPAGKGGAGKLPEAESSNTKDFSALNGDLISDLKAVWKEDLWDSWNGKGEDNGNDYAAFRAGDSYQSNPAGLPKGTLIIGYSYPYNGNDWFSSNFGRGLLDKPRTKEEENRILQVLKRAEPEGADVIADRFLKFCKLNYQKDESKSENFKAGNRQVTLDIREGRVTVYLWPSGSEEERG